MQKKSNTQVLVPINSSKTIKNHIHVAVRLKPMENVGSQNSSSRKATCPWTVVSDHTIRANSKESLTYTFDSVFGQQSSTEEIFSKDLYDILFNSLKGYNTTILAYG